MKNHGLTGYAAVALALALLAVPALGQGEPSAKEQELQQLLVEKAGTGAAGIRVTVDRAKAILTGVVPTRAVQELSEEVALSVDGIKSVDNRLRIDPPVDENTTKFERETEDANLEGKVKRQLYAEIGRRARKIEVEAVDGIVSLRGTVPDEARKKIALDAAAKTQGVERVVDLIKVKP